VKPDEDLPIGPLAFVGFIIPDFLGFPRKSCENEATKTLGPRGVSLKSGQGETKS